MAPLPAGEELEVGQTWHVAAFNLYVPAAHIVQGPPGGPLYPGKHKQAVIVPLPAGEELELGQAAHVPGLTPDLYVFNPHMLQAAPLFPI